MKHCCNFYSETVLTFSITLVQVEGTNSVYIVRYTVQMGDVEHVKGKYRGERREDNGDMLKVMTMIYVLLVIKYY